MLITKDNGTRALGCLGSEFHKQDYESWFICQCERPRLNFHKSFLDDFGPDILYQPNQPQSIVVAIKKNRRE